MDDVTVEDVNAAYTKGWKDCCIAFGITQEQQDALELRTVGCDLPNEPIDNGYPQQQ
jgi:hypothetical protein